MWHAWIERPRVQRHHTYHEPEHQKARRRPKKKTAKVHADDAREALRKPCRTQLRKGRRTAADVVPHPASVVACSVCDASDRRLTRHHLLPRASGGRNSAVNLIVICTTCHRLAHEWFGPGHRYDGPTDRNQFIAEMQWRFYVYEDIQ